MMKVGFVGTGNMASAIIKGMINKEHTKAEDIFVFDVDTEKMRIAFGNGFSINMDL